LSETWVKLDRDEDWDRLVGKALRGAGQPNGPRQRAALRKYAEEDDIPATCQDEDALLLLLENAAPVVCHMLKEASASGRPKPPKQRSYTPPAEMFTEHEDVRRRVLAKILVFRANEFPPVREFRERYLGQELLGEREALDFVVSPALSILTQGQLRDLGIPTRNPSSVALKPKVDVLWTKGGTQIAVVTVRCRCDWKVDGVPVSREVSRELPMGPKDSPIPWTTRHIQSEAVSMEFKFLADSVLHELDRVASWVARNPFWSESDAIWFVLTGREPQFPTIHVDFMRRTEGLGVSGRIVMQIQPWTNKETVTRVFQHSQRHMLGKANRPLSLESLEKLAFATNELGKSPDASWKELAERWDRLRKVRLGRTNPKTFQRDVTSTERELFEPIYPLGEDREQWEAHAEYMRAARLGREDSRFDLKLVKDKDGVARLWPVRKPAARRRRGAQQPPG